MPPIVISCPKSLKLLSVFLDGDADEEAQELEMIGAERVPEPYHRLLVHERDMTSTLSAFHDEEVALSVLHQRVADREVVRHVVLRGRRSGRALEFGASRIRLDALDGSARADVLQGEKPLGGILNAAGMHYRSCPGGFLRTRPHEALSRSLELDAVGRSQWLYGRCNCLSRGEGGTIAEVVEILPPWT